ncbi:nicotinamide N-methyltransferase Nnt1 [Schizosaccharomyces osmophilus]|uniref:Nicotinamide N-methyltransferase Nnt1 n=1 Tax=Schizosaccharomyces osmophilus TaxID=2545709 RepID=A0AAE9WA34_9SCHI|nr:nicotinamide N-methyltransferase Nnt1 [Schizosaccharomyces osmophilus]WBW70778.1 nicotinamide N-methyltransferase Nnt1 [Schizosaccharomyces osmophilus]
MTELDFEGFNMFEEPEGFRPSTPPPKTVLHERKTCPSGPKEVELQLVGSHSLWAHYLWNSGIVLSNFIDAHPEIVQGKVVLEFGAGAGLPSVVSAFDGAKHVVCSDYPDLPLIQNLEQNMKRYQEIEGKASAVGYLWGSDVQDLRNYGGLSQGQYFDVLLLSDLVFNHTEQAKLVRSCKAAMGDNKNAIAYVFFTHHRPHFANKDLLFFDIAKEHGFEVEKIVEEKRDPMFEHDQGAREVRATVHGYTMRLLHG